MIEVKAGDKVTVNHPVKGIVSGEAQWVTGSRFYIVKDGMMISCDNAYVVARYIKNKEI